MFETKITEMSGTHLSAYLNDFRNSETEGILLTYLLIYSMEQSPSWEANQ